MLKDCLVNGEGTVVGMKSSRGRNRCDFGWLTDDPSYDI